MPVGQSYWLQATETNFGLFQQKKLLGKYQGAHRSAREPKDLFKKVRDIRGVFPARVDTIRTEMPRT